MKNITLILFILSLPYLSLAQKDFHQLKSEFNQYNNELDSVILELTSLMKDTTLTLTTKKEIGLFLAKTSHSHSYDFLMKNIANYYLEIPDYTGDSDDIDAYICFLAIRTIAVPEAILPALFESIQIERTEKELYLTYLLLRMILHHDSGKIWLTYKKLYHPTDKLLSKNINKLLHYFN